MKHTLLFLALASACLAADEAATNIQITTEFLEVDVAVATELTHGASAPKTTTAWGEKLRELVKDAKTVPVASLTVTSNSGQRASATGGLNKLYSVEFDPAQGRGSQSPSVPATPTGVDVPTPTSFEMKPTGARLEVDPVSNGSTIELTLAPELVIYLGEDPVMKIPGNDEPAMTMPRFYEMKVTTSVTVTDGGSVLAGVMVPPTEEGSPDATKRVLVFVTARLVTAK
jgi:Flp pilus assembly secretin CpaC